MTHMVSMSVYLVLLWLKLIVERCKPKEKDFCFPWYRGLSGFLSLRIRGSSNAHSFSNLTECPSSRFKIGFFLFTSIYLVPTLDICGQSYTGMLDPHNSDVLWGSSLFEHHPLNYVTQSWVWSFELFNWNDRSSRDKKAFRHGYIPRLIRTSTVWI